MVMVSNLFTHISSCSLASALSISSTLFKAATGTAPASKRRTNGKRKGGGSAEAGLCQGGVRFGSSLTKISFSFGLASRRERLKLFPFALSSSPEFSKQLRPGCLRADPLCGLKGSVFERRFIREKVHGGASSSPVPVLVNSERSLNAPFPVPDQRGKRIRK